MSARTAERPNGAPALEDDRLERGDHIVGREARILGEWIPLGPLDPRAQAGSAVQRQGRQDGAGSGFNLARVFSRTADQRLGGLGSSSDRANSPLQASLRRGGPAKSTGHRPDRQSPASRH